MKLNKIDSIYQELAEKFVEIIPVKWDKVLFYSEVEEGAISLHYIFYESATKQLKNAESLNDEYGIDRKRIKLYSIDLSRLVAKLQRVFIEEGLEKWNRITFILESTGKFKVDFDYENLESSNVIERRKEWEKKYVNY